eukprot:m.108287 g.108287  ORF g.108287 m.108287 type:complete len:849 (+) comp13957_c0_seq2:145-2691(+)
MEDSEDATHLREDIILSSNETPIPEILSPSPPSTITIKSKSNVDDQSRADHGISPQLSEPTLFGVVREFLLVQGFMTTVQKFDEEAKARNIPSEELAINPPSTPECRNLLASLTEKLDRGEYEGFFSEWNRVVPQLTSSTVEECKKIEFYVNVWFAIYSVVNNGDESSQEHSRALDRFKQYIENRGQHISKTAECLPYYALPFVPDIRNHTSFKALFEPVWISSLKERVKTFLLQTLPSAKATPRLQQLWDLAKSNNGLSQSGVADTYVNTLQQQLVQFEEREIQHIDRHNALQKDYHALLSTATELVEALEASVKGTPIKPSQLIAVCTKLSDCTVSSSVGPMNYGVERSLQNVVGLQMSLAQNEKIVVTGLDYDKIHHDLVTLNNRNAAVLLQALRWQLTRTAHGESRDKVLHNFIENDILGIKKKGGPAIHLMSHNSELVREYFTRLLNCFASLSGGRSYLRESSELLKAMRGQIAAEDGDNMVRQNILGTMQKLSLRRTVQTMLIKLDTIAWVIELLSSADHLSEYSVEYAVALMMNLCLRTSGKLACVPQAAQVLRTLTNLLDHDNYQVRTYIHGTLYSLLSNDEIREAAKAIGLEAVLLAEIEASDGKLVVQLKYIIQQLNQTESDTPKEEIESDDDEEIDDDEEDDSEDLMMADISEGETLNDVGASIDDVVLVGPQLLKKKYSAVKQSAEPEQQQRPESRMPKRSASRGMRQHTNNTGFGRPTTPKHSSRPSSRQINPSRPSSRQINPSRPVSGRSTHTASRPSSSRPASSRSQSHRVAPQPFRPLSSQKKVMDEREPPPPSKRTLESLATKGDDVDINEYKNAFSSRPQVPRTPLHSYN